MRGQSPKHLLAFSVQVTPLLPHRTQIQHGAPGPPQAQSHCCYSKGRISLFEQEKKHFPALPPLHIMKRYGSATLIPAKGSTPMPVSSRSSPGLFSLPLIPLQQEPPAVWSPGFSRDQRAGVSDLIIPLETAVLCSPSENQPGAREQ